jgi:hypothetical protein
LWSEDSSHAVDWRLLDSAVRDSEEHGLEVYLVNALAGRGKIVVILPSVWSHRHPV